MNFEPPRKLEEIAAILGRDFVGPPAHEITGMNEIHRVRQGELVFVDNPKYYDRALRSPATTILIDRKVDAPEGKALILSEAPFGDYNALAKRFRPFLPLSAAVSQNALVGEGTVIEPNVVIGDYVEIGRDCIIHPGVVIGNHTRIGNEVEIQANTAVGTDAFYYKKTDKGRVKLHSCGSTVIEDRVGIGAGCTIDRGVSDATIIGAGTKIDNLVQIGHDTVIGKDCLFAAQVGLSGCVTVEDEVVLWGQVGVPSALTIGARAVVLGQSGVPHSLQGDTTYLGSPADEARKRFREMAALRKLPDLVRHLEG